MSTCPDCETGRNLLAGACRSVFQRGLTGGSAGNMSPVSYTHLTLPTITE